MQLNYSQNMQQQMKMSPQMIQSIGIMTLPAAELRERIYEEAEKNPAIEIVKDAQLEPVGVHLSTKAGSTSDSDAWQAFLESAPAPAESLQDHLLAQLALLDLSASERRIGERIIQNLDSRGFNNADPETLLRVDDSLALMAKMLDLVRRLDPVGTACSSFQESLLVQAMQIEDAPLLALEILKNQFLALEKKRPALIRKVLEEGGIQCSLKETEDALDFIRSLEPFPARRFDSGSTAQYVTPELVVRRAAADEVDTGNEKNSMGQGAVFVIEFLRGNLPEIEVSAVYADLAAQKKIDAAERKFAAEAVKEAQWFINTLLHRTRSIYRAVQAIVSRQLLFFDKGPGHLQPLRMKDIAEEIGVHETTVSRIANGKYLQCEWGVFEIKYFFTNAVGTDTVFASKNTAGSIAAGQDSKESVKHQLQLIIAEHEKNGDKKLSDSKLSSLLAQRGIKLARRTVAKYRSELQIDSSFDRI